MLPPLVLAELEQALIVAYLCANQSNYTAQLNGKARGATPWQVRRAEEYITAHWDQPITIEALALVTNTSARSLFDTFKKHRGYSPMSFLKRVRLQHARALLERPTEAISVTAVAYACGFSNLGHFAKDYLLSFGELPSATLKASRHARGA
jgi:transcriptional regulator GlxA family with amidase domain